MRPLRGRKVIWKKPFVPRFLLAILSSVLLVTLLLSGFVIASRGLEKNDSSTTSPSPLRIVYNANNPSLEPQNKKGQAEVEKISLSGAERAWREHHKTISVGIDAAWPPIDFLDKTGVHRGITADYLRLLSAYCGIEFKPDPVSGWAAMLEQAKARKLDIVATLAWTPERTKFWQYSELYFSAPYVIVTPKEITGINGVEDLNGMCVAVEKGYKLQSRLSCKYPEITLLPVTSSLKALEAVSRNRADAYIGNQAVALWLIEQNSLSNLKVAADSGFERNNIHIGVRPDWPELTSILNKGFALISDQKHRDIRRKWLGPAESDRQAPSLALTVVERQWLAEHPKIRLGVDPSWPPIEYIAADGSYQGIAADYIGEISKILLTEMKPLADLSWSQVIQKSKAGEADILPAVTVTRERKKFLNFTASYLNFPLVIFVAEDFPVITGLNDLSGKQVAVEKDYVTPEWLERDYRDLNVKTFATTREALLALSLGKVDAYVGNLAVGGVVMRQAGITNVRIGAPTKYSTNLTMGVRKDWPQLKAILDKALAAVPDNRKIHILERWLPFEQDFTESLHVEISNSEQEFLKAHPVISLGVDPEFVPFEFIDEDGVYSGIAADYIKILKQRLGLNMEVVPDLSWSEVVAKSKKREIDILPCVGKTYERLSFLNFSTPYIKYQRVIITRTDYPFVAGLNDLHDAGVAVQANTSHEGFLYDYTDIKALSFATLEETLTAVSSGKADAMIGNIASASHWIRRLNLTNLKVAAPAQLETLDLHFAVRKDWPELVSIINKGLASISHEEKNRIFRKWISIKYEPGIALRNVIKYILQIVAGALLVLALFFYWNRRLAGLNRQLAAARSEADRANRFKSGFLANMSHEIRTPMNAIMGVTHLALQTTLLPKQRDYLTKVENASRDLLNIVNDILDFSKIEAGKLKVEEIPFQLDDVLDNLAGLIASKAQKKGLEFLLKVAPETPLALLGDPLRLGQVLTNLTGNAIKFTETGEIVISVDLEAEEEKRVCLLFAVSDSGIGLSPKQQKQLFHSFSQVDASITRRFGGTGLGLAICRQLVGLMGGEIGVESELGHGSTFSFKLWLTKAPFQSLTLLQPEADLRGMRVLVVDDSEMACDVLREALESFTFQVTTVNSGLAALEELEKGVRDERLYKMVFMDWQMEGIDGIETSKRIRQRGYPELATIIMVTAYGREEVMHQAEQIKLDGFLIKPVNRSLLFDAIMTALGRKKVVPGTPRIQEENKPVEYNFKGEHVLLVEDNEINRQVVRELLEKVGFKVSEAVNGREAVNAVAQTEFAAVLMDIQMPEMDGITATREIRKTNSAIPIIATTAHAMVEEREKCLAAGMNDHVSKPIDPQKLYAALGIWLGKPESVSATVAPENQLTLESDIFSELNSLDYERALKMVDGNRPLLTKLFGKFVKNHGCTDVEISTALEQGDKVLAHRLIHTVAGVAGTIGAYDLERVSRALLKAIKNEENIEIETLLRDFSREQARVLASLHDFKGS